MPFVEYEAEAAATTGVILPADRTFGGLASEASGRQAVRLSAGGQEVSFTLAADADAVTIRYAVPDAPSCHAGDATIGLYVAGDKVADVPLTPCYGWFYGEYPFSNHANAGGGHHFYDHVRLRLAQTALAGTVVSLRYEQTTSAPWVVIDLADFEIVSPATRAPDQAISVISFGADPTGRRASLHAFQRAIDAGRHARRPVWIPEGTFRIEGHLVVDDVSLIGAGPWRSVLRGRGVGVVARPAPTGSRDVTLSGFAIIGEVMARHDRTPDNAVGGAFNRSHISDLFLQHTKVGLWLDGPFEGLVVDRLRIFDQTADGVNFHGGVTRSVVQNTFVRGTGDDGLAMWSHPQPNHDNVFRHNTVVAPVLANGIAIYGGGDVSVEGNVVADTVTRGGGLHLGSRFDSTAVQGTIRFSDNTLLRTGSTDPAWRHGIGAIWFYALDRPLSGARILVQDNAVVDSTDSAIQLIGKPVSGLEIDRLTVEKATALWFIDASGQARLGNVTVSGLRGPVIERRSDGFRLDDAGGNVGWSPRD